MKIVKKHVISNFLFKLACVDDADEKMHFANLLEINTIYIVLPLYQCPYTPSRQRFSSSLEAFSGAITFNVRVYFKQYTPFKTQTFATNKG